MQMFIQLIDAKNKALISWAGEEVGYVSVSQLINTQRESIFAFCAVCITSCTWRRRVDSSYCCWQSQRHWLNTSEDFSDVDQWTTWVRESCHSIGLHPRQYPPSNISGLPPAWSTSFLVFFWTNCTTFSLIYLPIWTLKCSKLICYTILCTCLKCISLYFQLHFAKIAANIKICIKASYR